MAKPADAATPVIVNSGQWLESQASAGQTGDSANKAWVTVYVKHDPGLTVTGLRVDEDYNGSYNTPAPRTPASPGSGGQMIVDPQPVMVGGYQYSRVTYSWRNSTSGLSGYSTGTFCTGGTENQDRPLWVQAVLSNGQETAAESATIRLSRTSSCALDTNGRGYVYGQSQNRTVVTPGTGSQTVTFNYGCGKSGGLALACGGLRYRLRRVNDGYTTAPVMSCNPSTTTVDFTGLGRGYWVVEANPRFGVVLSDACGATGGRENHWFYLGAVDVNSAPSVSPLTSLSATRPVVNGNSNVTVNDFLDLDWNGQIQDIEWDKDQNTSNGVDGFEEAVHGDHLTGLVAGANQRSINTTGMTPGWKTVRTRVTDNGAFTGGDTGRVQRIDTTEFLVDAPPVADNNTGQVESDETLPITLTASDSDVWPAKSINDNNTLDYTIVDSPDHGSLTSPDGDAVVYDPSDDFSGEDQFTFQVDDGWGGTDTAVVKIKVDPASNIDAYPLTEQDSRGSDIEFSSPTEGSTLVKFECSLDFGPWYDCDSPDELRDLSDGNHNQRVRAVGGNYEGTPTVDPTPAEVEWQINATPHITFDSTPTPDSGDASPTFEFTAAEAGATVPLNVECKLDDGPRQPCASPVELTDVADGFHTFTVFASDEYGRNTQASYDWEIRVGGIHTWITDRPAAFSPSSDSEFGFDTSDPTNTFECRFNGGSWDPCTSPQVLTGLTDGEYTFEVRAVNTAGESDHTPASWTWTIDTQAPSVGIDDAPPTITNQPVSLVFNSDEQVVDYLCSIDGGDFDPCSSPYTGPANLADGDHELQVVAVDRAGNQSVTPANAEWELDTVLPTSQIATGPAADALRNVDTASFTFTSNEPGTFQCRLDGQSWRDCDAAGAQDYAGIPDGDHTFRVRAIDRAGNIEADPQSRSWKSDTVRPVVNITDGPSGTVKETTGAFAFDSSEAGSTFECKLDGGTFGACSSPQSYTGLGDGKHQFSVRATDVAGNVSEYAAKRDWTVKTGTGKPTPPDPDAACNFHSDAPKCAQPSLSGKQKRVGKAKRRTTAPAATFSAGTTALESLYLSFGKGSVLSLNRKAKGKPVARLVLKTKTGSQTVALKVDRKAKLGKKAKGAVGLAADGVSASLSRGAAPALSITTLPDDVSSVQVTLKGRGLTVKTKKCGTQKWMGSAVDRDGYPGSATTWVDPPCPKPSKKGAR